MNIALFKNITIATIVVVPMLYYFYLGGKAFRAEMIEFASTPDNTSEISDANYLAMSEIADEVSWQLKDGSRQRAFYIPSKNGALIIYVHGSPGVAAGFRTTMESMAEYGYGGLAIDLPGYGGSEGRNDWGETFIESVSAAVDFVVQQAGIDPSKIGGFGYSMGVCILANAAAKDNRIGPLVLLAGYTNLYDQLHYQFRRRIPGMGFFAVAAAIISGVQVMQMDTQSALAEGGDRPVFIVSGTNDHAIPTDMAKILADTAKNAEIWLVNGADHVNFIEKSGDEYFDRIHSFFDKAFRLIKSA